MTKTFKLKNKHILGLGNWLGSIPLSGPESRKRTQFVKMLEVALDSYEKKRKAMLEEVAEREEDGSLKIVETEGGSKNYVIPDEIQDDFHAKIAALNETEYELDGPEAMPVFLALKDIVLNYKGEIDGSIATQYDQWCEAFEAWSADSE